MNDQLGIFARTFRRSNADQVASAVRHAGYGVVQLNVSAFGAPTVPTPADIDRVDPPAVAAAFARHEVTVWGVSATFNLIDPDQERRDQLIHDAATWIAAVPALGARYATLCTGTRDPDNMWRSHPENDTPSAWLDMRTALAPLLAAARQSGVRLGIEPEPGNVIRDAAAAQRLISELGRDADLVGIVLDPANLLTPHTVGQAQDILRDAVDRLAPHVVCVHAKDFDNNGTVPAGMGLLDYDSIARLRAALPHEVPLIVQDVTEGQAAEVRSRLGRLLGRHPWPSRAD